MQDINDSIDLHADEAIATDEYILGSTCAAAIVEHFGR